MVLKLLQSFVSSVPILWCLSVLLLLDQVSQKTALASTRLGGNETDQLALLSIKAQITHDPMLITSSWNDSLHFCKWKGVLCGQRHLRVTGLNLESYNLAGFISPSIGNLSFLRIVNFTNNSFQGGIPHEMGRLFRLRVLDLSVNLMEGQILGNLSHCNNLRILSLTQNKFIGNLPKELGSLSRLVELNIQLNNLTREIPASFGNLSSLQRFMAGGNMLEGNIPGSLGRLKGLRFLGLTTNKLSEYGMGNEVSTFGDVYSYGILLLELFTGKRPTDDMFIDGLDLHKLAKLALPERVVEIVDQNLLEEEEGAKINSLKQMKIEKIRKCLSLIFRIGVACSEQLPTERITIADVVRELHLAKDILLERRT